MEKTILLGEIQKCKNNTEFQQMMDFWNSNGECKFYYTQTTDNEEYLLIDDKSEGISFIKYGDYHIDFNTLEETIEYIKNEEKLQIILK